MRLKVVLLMMMVCMLRGTSGLLWQRLIRRSSSMCVQRNSPIPETSQQNMISLSDWQESAHAHASNIENLLYPKCESRVKRPQAKELRARSQLVHDHPIYNFLHDYYQYSLYKLKYYSPGVDTIMESARPGEFSDQLDVQFMSYTENGGAYDPNKFLTYIKSRKYGLERLIKARDILKTSFHKPAFFGCFGMHEWAMLYSGNGTIVKGHQQHLPRRVDQQTIDSLVGTPGQMRCTHFDAFRFFQPSAKPFNAVTQLSRDSQVRYEQPGCIHANMDLFKYAYMAYPVVSSKLLVQALQLALEARKVDMRASPYDVSSIAGCEIPICVETLAGRKLYVDEQERVATLAVPVRKQLLEVYENLIECNSCTSSLI